MHHVDSDIELDGKAIPRYRECRMGCRVVPSVVAYEFSHDSQHTCQSMTCHGSRRSRKDWHKCASELIYSLWWSASFFCYKCTISTPVDSEGDIV